MIGLYRLTKFVKGVMQDLLLVINEDKLFITDAGQRYISEGGIMMAQLLTCLVQMPYIREYTSKSIHTTIIICN
jgi:hypothetical protein